MRFTDGRDADLLSLPLLVDSTAPSVLELGVASTTVELTVYLRAQPAPGWLACRQPARFVSGGYHEEDFEVWDSAGALVAQSRQLAVVRPVSSSRALHLGSLDMQADRVAGALAAQCVSAAVHPLRSRPQDRAGRCSLGCLTRDHGGHVAVARLPGVIRRQDHQPRTVTGALLDHDFCRTARLEAHESPPALRGGGQDPQAAGQPASGHRHRPAIRVVALGVHGLPGWALLGRDEQGRLSELGEFRGDRHVGSQRRILRASSGSWPRE